MRIQKIELHNFRGYENLSLALESGVNVLVGKNGAGKTNLAEAISFLSLARSFRTNDEKEIRKHGEQFSRIRGLFQIGERKLKVDMLLTSKGKQIQMNGSDIKTLSELLSECHVLVFKPGDAFLFDESPSERRRLMNLEISRQSKKYLLLVRRYEKLLQERNALLKEENVELNQLEIVTQMMIEVSKEIMSFRNLFFEKIKPVVEKVSHFLTNGLKRFEFKYIPFVKMNNIEENAKIAFEKAKDNDLRYGATTIGVHREDFSCALNGVELSTTGSQGEKRLAALILKLAIYELVKEKEKKPILILDDVFSELDEERQSRLLELVKGYDQVIITTTEWNKEIDATVYEVANHKVTRRITYGR